MSLETKRNSYRLVGKDILLPIYLATYSGVEMRGKRDVVKNGILNLVRKKERLQRLRFFVFSIYVNTQNFVFYVYKESHGLSQRSTTSIKGLVQVK